MATTIKVLETRFSGILKKKLKKFKLGDGTFLALIERLLPIFLQMFSGSPSMGRSKAVRRKNTAKRATGRLGRVQEIVLRMHLRQELDAPGEKVLRVPAFDACVEMAKKTKAAEVEEVLVEAGQ